MRPSMHVHVRMGAHEPSRMACSEEHLDGCHGLSSCTGQKHITEGTAQMRFPYLVSSKPTPLGLLSLADDAVEAVLCSKLELPCTIGDSMGNDALSWSIVSICPSILQS